MKFQTSKECMDLGLRAGVIEIRNINMSLNPSDIDKEVSLTIDAICSKYATTAEIRQSQEISKLHEIFRATGVNPRKTQPASQRLAEFALKKNKLPSINNLVNAYNLCSARTLCCLGAHDADKIKYPIELRILNGTETFTPLGAKQRQSIIKGEFGYVDGNNQIICRLDVMQGDFSKVVEDTKNIFLIIEGTTALSESKLRGVFESTAETITKACGGEAEITYFPY